MKRRNSRNNKGIATWLKWMLGIMAVGFVLCLATCGAVGFFGYQQIQNAMNPENAQKVAGTIVTIKPLPTNFKYSFGMDMMVMTMVAIQDTKGKVTYMLIRIPTTGQTANEPKSADEFVDQMAAQGVPTAGNTGRTTIEVKEKGKTKAAGVDMPYIIGISENKSSGKKLPAFLGCVMPDKNTAIMVCAASEDEDKPINMVEVNDFLSNIQEFKAVTP
ncbi:MAG: hypothetical protein SGJ27_08060 [Candidatus Melainabacteria bacterium]|nr:hypothetical protein [Candidatus Melainabacteria bacterium]